MTFRINTGNGRTVVAVFMIAASVLAADASEECRQTSNSLG